MAGFVGARRQLRHTPKIEINFTEWPMRERGVAYRRNANIVTKPDCQIGTSLGIKNRNCLFKVRPRRDEFASEPFGRAEEAVCDAGCAGVRRLLVVVKERIGQFARCSKFATHMAYDPKSVVDR